MRRVVVLLGIYVSFLGCKKDGPSVPGEAVLEFPGDNSECTTGVDTSPTTSEVEFRWQASANTESYELQVMEIGSEELRRAITVTTAFSMNLDKGTPYSWKVISRNTESQQTTESVTWQFYNAGSLSSYPPFPASILQPESGQTIAANGNGQVVLSWSGADADGDILEFEIWIGTTSDALVQVGTRAADQSSYAHSVTSGTVYFWKIRTLDEGGNSSDTGIYSFRVL